MKPLGVWPVTSVPGTFVALTGALSSLDTGLDIRRGSNVEPNVVVTVSPDAQIARFFCGQRQRQQRPQLDIRLDIRGGSNVESNVEASRPQLGIIAASLQGQRGTSIKPG